MPDRGPDGQGGVGGGHGGAARYQRAYPAPMQPAEARALFAATPVARLATVGADGLPHLVPVCFAVLGDRIVTAVDHKPKRTSRLRRLANIEANPAVCLLVDAYDAADWSALWWARADGTAQVADADAPGVGRVRSTRVERYPQYRVTRPEGPVIEIAVTRWERVGLPPASPPAAAVHAGHRPRRARRPRPSGPSASTRPFASWAGRPPRGGGGIDLDDRLDHRIASLRGLRRGADRPQATTAGGEVEPGRADLDGVAEVPVGGVDGDQVEAPTGHPEGVAGQREPLGRIVGPAQRRCQPAGASAPAPIADTSSAR